MSIGKIDNSLIRIPVIKTLSGYYIRWWYNGWHYWQFIPGTISHVTEGQKYHTLGTRVIAMSSGPITLEQVSAIRTIKNSREAYILTDAGWRNLLVNTGSVQVYNNMINAYEVEFSARIGSREISHTGYSPTTFIPVMGIIVTSYGGATSITTDGGTLQMYATVLPINATYKQVTWSVVGSCATIDSTGLLTALVNGTIEVRAKASDGSGIYGSMEITITGNDPLTDIDGNIYQTVVVGNQEWITSNLKVTKYADGSLISFKPVLSAFLTDATGGCYTYPNYAIDGVANKEIYGLYYSSFAFSNAKGLIRFNRGVVIETGWRVPSLADWAALSIELGGNTVSGGKMKEVGNAHWNYVPSGDNEGASNESGLTMVGAGFLRYNGYQDFGLYNKCWATNTYAPKSVGIVGVFRSTDDFYPAIDDNNHGYSIRAVRDI
jgi:uncharacterized protein (TIGR02145 family)